MGTQEPTFLILTALAAQPLHGYGVIRSVSELSHGEVNSGAGALAAQAERLRRNAATAETELDRRGGIVPGLSFTAGAA
ncbi:PadR family transcriptional regulator [Couchioplanes caeruleus]|uniref:PadR family transcriptional regulator n=1 Tax=Couchioplanes caeruleus TaxID=56438 RepID=UPI0020BD827C|nr:PadR family transcriptional regulator [Couchioplanes caeruleus]UQU68597.1 PadR family transcriptional regulator [Couchioplanes caeruleus]